MFGDDDILDIELDSLVIEWHGEQRRLVEVLATASPRERVQALVAFATHISKLQAALIELSGDVTIN